VEWLALLLTLLGLGGPPRAPGEPQPQPVTYEHIQVNGQQAIVLTPAHPNNRLVLFTHGALQTASDAVADKHKQDLFRTLLEHGYTIAASEAQGDGWGNDASISDHVALADHLRRRGLNDVVVLSESMGGISGLLALRQLHARAWAGLYPVCNVMSMYTRRTPVTRMLKPYIRAAYRVRNAAQLARAARSRSPVRITGVRGLPMIFWASAGDTLVPKDANTDRCAADARRNGAHVTVVEAAGDHGNETHLDAARLVAFYDAAVS
jgi:hypothetical protein